MLECLADLLRSAILEFVKQWLRDWGNLLLTAVIALAAVMQGVFPKRQVISLSGDGGFTMLEHFH